jgi:hypothetical protein
MTKKCQFCDRQVLSSKAVCPYCSRSLVTGASTRSAGELTARPWDATSLGVFLLCLAIMATLVWVGLK